MLTAMTDRTPAHLQLGEGVFLTGVDRRACPDGPSLRRAVTLALAEGRTLGMTRRGGSFLCRPELLRREEAGHRQPDRDNTAVIRWQAELRGVMSEVTPETAAYLLGGRTEAQDGVTAITPGRTPGHIHGLCWAGDLGDGLVCICLDEAVCETGMQLRFAPGQAGELPFRFTAVQTDPAETEPPFSVLILEEGADAAE